MSSLNQAYRLINTATAAQLAPTTLERPAPGAREVVVRMAAASFNYRDLLVLQGRNGATREGLIPLSDGAGTVVAVGAEVRRWQVGDRVATVFFPLWQDGKFRDAYRTVAPGGGQTDGVLAEEIVVAEAALAAVPDHLSLAQAATLPCAGVTAWQALFARGGLRAGDTVLIQGTGGVALFALQLAVAQDARPIVISSSDEKLERARALGAWQTVNYRREPAWDEAVLRLTEGAGVTHVMELGGPDTFPRSINAVAAGGHILQIGVLTGFGPTPNLLPLQFKNADILGICVGSRAHHEELNTFLARHRIPPVIDQVFGFDEVPAAYALLEGSRHFGKVIVTF